MTKQLVRRQYGQCQVAQFVPGNCTTTENRRGYSELPPKLMDAAKTRMSLELLAKGGELLLNFGEFPSQRRDFFFQIGEAIGAGRSGVR